MTTASRDHDDEHELSLADELEFTLRGYINTSVSWESLREYSEFGKTRILDMLHDETVSGRDPMMVISRLVNVVNMRCPERYTHDLLTYIPAMDGGIPVSEVQALHLYRKSGWIPARPDLEPNPTALKFMRTHMEIRNSLPISSPSKRSPFMRVVFYHRDNLGVSVLKDERLVRLLWDQPDDSEKILDIVIERQAADWETISDVLGNSSPALSEGVL